LDADACGLIKSSAMFTFDSETQTPILYSNKCLNFSLDIMY
jgi:hypothetical protein